MPTIILASYDPEWPLRFKEIGAALRAALKPVLGDRLTGVHHIRSTSAPGLAAKPIIDVQVSIRDFRPWSRTDLVASDEQVEKPSREHVYRKCCSGGAAEIRQKAAIAILAGLLSTDPAEP